MKHKSDKVLPKRWDAARLQRALAHYDNQSDEAALAEDEAAGATPGQTTMTVPTSLVPAVRALLKQHAS
jgi:hypothetical protein